MLLSGRYKNDGRATVHMTPKQRGACSVLLQKLKSGQFENRLRPCLLCDSNEFSVVAEKDRYGIPMRTGVCKHCGMVQTIDQMRPADYDEFYSGIYRKLYEEESTPDSLFRKQEDRGNRLVAIAKQYTPSLSGLRMVEVGCGAGGIVARFVAAGCDAQGFDFDKSFLEYGRQRGGNLTHGNAFELVPAESCDIVVLSHVLEHIFEPVSMLKNLRSLLKPNGILIIAVPGLRNISVRHYQLDFLKYLQNAHLFHFDSETLKAIAGRSALECAYIDEDVYAVCVRAPEAKALTVLRPEKHAEVMAYLSVLEQKRRRSQGALLMRSMMKTLRESGGRTLRNILGPKGIVLIKTLLGSAQRA
jgi:2-polyprenyl-3-methyl-5-hydroxy-6-metoxy-1,4-benzoquinol methylase